MTTTILKTTRYEDSDTKTRYVYCKCPRCNGLMEQDKDWKNSRFLFFCMEDDCMTVLPNSAEIDPYESHRPPKEEYKRF